MSLFLTITGTTVVLDLISVPLPILESASENFGFILQVWCLPQQLLVPCP